MARLKIELTFLHEDRDQWTGRIETFIDEVDRWLRSDAVGEEWAVSAGAREWRNEDDGEKYRTTSVFCEVHDVRDRWPGVRDLLETHDLLDQAVVTGVLEEEGDLERVWPDV